MNEISKPITVARKDLLEDIVSAINKSALPAFIVSELLKNVLLSVDKLAVEQLERDTREYEEALNLAGEYDGRPFPEGRAEPPKEIRHKKGGGVNGRR